MDTVTGNSGVVHAPVRSLELRSALALASATLGEEFLIPAGQDLPDGFSLSGPSEAKNPRNGSLMFLAGRESADAGQLAALSDCLIIAPFEAWADFLAARNFLVRARNPKYAYALVAGHLYPLSAWRGELGRAIGTESWAAANVELAEGVIVEPGVTIGKGSRIGCGCILMHGCTIGPHVSIGEGSIIREMAVIGDLGFGFAFDGDRPPLRLPQLGGVSLGQGVEIGAFSTIGAGTMRPTLIGGYVKISDHVHIAHNCRIGAKTIITGGVIVSGSTNIGESCWLAPGAILRNRITLGSNVTVGMGAVVTADVAEGVTVLGVPARPIDRLPGKPVSQA